MEAVADEACGQIADKPAQCTCAKLAPHPTPDLRRNAQCVAVFVAHQHALDDVAVKKAKQKLLRAVYCRSERFDNYRRTRHAVSFQFVAQCLWQVGHFVEVGVFGKPIENLLAYKRLNVVVSRYEVGKFRLGEILQ